MLQQKQSLFIIFPELCGCLPEGRWVSHKIPANSNAFIAFPTPVAQVNPRPARWELELHLQRRVARRSVTAFYRGVEPQTIGKPWENHGKTMGK